MPIVVDLYTPRPSWLHAVDPRVKLLFVASAILLLLVFNNLLFMGAALLLIHLLYWSAQIPLKKVIFVWKTLLPVSLLMATLWILFYPTGPAVAQFWMIKITPQAAAQGLVLALRINAMALAVFAWLYTTSHPALIRSLVKLGLPFEWGLVLALALRYIPTFQGTYTLIAQAQQARGLDISSGTGFKRVRAMMPIFVAMIISSLRASDQLAKALESRALGASGVRRTTRHDIHFQPVDYLLIGLLLTLILGLMYLKLSYGFGSDPLNFFV